MSFARIFTALAVAPNGAARPPPAAETSTEPSSSKSAVELDVAQARLLRRIQRDDGDFDDLPVEVTQAAVDYGLLPQAQAADARQELGAFETAAWGEPSLPLSTAMSQVANGFIRALLEVDTTIEHNALVAVIPGAATTGAQGPRWRASHWIGSNGTVTKGPVPGWLPFEGSRREPLVRRVELHHRPGRKQGRSQRPAHQDREWLRLRPDGAAGRSPVAAPSPGPVRAKIAERCRHHRTALSHAA